MFSTGLPAAKVRKFPSISPPYEMLARTTTPTRTTTRLYAHCGGSDATHYFPSSSPLRFTRSPPPLRHLSFPEPLPSSTSCPPQQCTESSMNFCFVYRSVLSSPVPRATVGHLSTRSSRERVPAVVRDREGERGTAEREARVAMGRELRRTESRAPVDS